MSQTNENRIDILESILLQLHNGAEPESVQEEFNKHFTGVSAIEISMMEHQLIYGDGPITFMDVLKLCNVHANLFKGTVEDGEVHDADQPGHPVAVFKEENMALRSALMRINNILETFEKLPVEELNEGMINGLKRQYDLLGQFDNHYKRKEHLFFPMMEKYGHDAPPKVMWAKDDEIRDQFKRAYKAMEKFPAIEFSKMKQRFEEFQFEFNEMIFKEEAILINILLEVLTQKDWYDIASHSDNYGYSIIRPREKWEPELELEPKAEEPVDKKTESVKDVSKIVVAKTNPTDSLVIETRKIKVNGGYMTVSWEADSSQEDGNTSLLNPTVPIAIGDGFLSLEQIKLVFDYIPAKVTFVDANDLVQYYNHKDDDKNDLRRPEQIGNHVKNIYTPELWDSLSKVIHSLKSGELQSETFWYKRDEEFIHLEYKALYDTDGNYQGFVEINQNIQPIFDIETEKWRNLMPASKIDLTLKSPADLSVINQNNLADSQQIDFNHGQLNLSWLPNQIDYLDDPSQFDFNQAISIGHGFLSLNQVRWVFDALPFEITFVDEFHKFRYFNNIVPYDEMLFQRSPLEIGRDLEYCHPARVWPKVYRLSEDLKHQKRFIEPMWFSPFGKLIYILYKGTQDQHDDYRGIVETVQDASEYIKLAGTEKHII